MSNTLNGRNNLLTLVQFSLLLAIEAVVCFTVLGSLPLGPIVATLSHIPVIITAVAMGTGAGAAMGFAFGLFSFIVWTFMPPSPIAFVFTPFYSFGEVQGNIWSLVICFVPRILIGVTAGLIAKYFETRLPRKKSLGYMLAGVFGSMTNTILVLLGIYVFFGKEYAAATETAYELLLGSIGIAILTNGVVEAILGGVVAAGVAGPLKKAVAKQLR